MKWGPISDQFVNIYPITTSDGYKVSLSWIYEPPLGWRCLQPELVFQQLLGAGLSAGAGVWLTGAELELVFSAAAPPPGTLMLTWVQEVF